MAKQIKLEEMKKSKKPSCTECGICCWCREEQDMHCEVTESDVKRLGTWGRRNFVGFSFMDRIQYSLRGSTASDRFTGGLRTKWIMQRSGPLKGRQVLVCAGLRGSLLNKTHCSVYDRRPKVCRIAIKPGDKACLKLREMVLREIEGWTAQERVKADLTCESL